MELAGRLRWKRSSSFPAHRSSPPRRRTSSGARFFLDCLFSRGETQELRLQRREREAGMEGAFADQVEPGAVPFKSDRARLEIVIDQIDQPVSLAIRHGAEEDAFAVPGERNRQWRNVTVKLGEELFRGEIRRFSVSGRTGRGLLYWSCVRLSASRAIRPPEAAKRFSPSKAFRVMFSRRRRTGALHRRFRRAPAGVRRGNAPGSR